MTKPQRSDGPTETPVEQHQRPEQALLGAGDAVRRPVRRTRRAIAAVQAQPLSPEQVHIWEKAVAFCVRHLPTLWTAGEPRRQPGPAERWIVPIVLCYPDGFEGRLGEMAWDEQSQEFTILTERTVLSERARTVAASRPTHDSKPAPPEAGA